jgi:hypothetical protein
MACENERYADKGTDCSSENPRILTVGMHDIELLPPEKTDVTEKRRRVSKATRTQIVANHTSL